MKTAFPEIDRIRYEGPESKNPLAFRHYNADEVVEGKTMRDHLRFSVVYWHTFRGTGRRSVRPRHRRAALGRRHRLGRERPEPRPRGVRVHGEARQRRSTASTIATSRPKARRSPRSNTQPRRRRRRCSRKSSSGPASSCSGAPPTCSAIRATCTAPPPARNADVFAYAAAQVKKALEVTKELGGERLHLLGRPRRLPEPAGTPT